MSKNNSLTLIKDLIVSRLLEHGVIAIDKSPCDRTGKTTVKELRKSSFFTINLARLSLFKTIGFESFEECCEETLRMMKKNVELFEKTVYIIISNYKKIIVEKWEKLIPLYDFITETATRIEEVQIQQSNWKDYKLKELKVIVGHFFERNYHFTKLSNGSFSNADDVPVDQFKQWLSSGNHLERIHFTPSKTGSIEFLESIEKQKFKHFVFRPVKLSNKDARNAVLNIISKMSIKTLVFQNDFGDFFQTVTEHLSQFQWTMVDEIIFYSTLGAVYNFHKIIPGIFGNQKTEKRIIFNGCKTSKSNENAQAVPFRPTQVVQALYNENGGIQDKRFHWEHGSFKLISIPTRSYLTPEECDSKAMIPIPQTAWDAPPVFLCLKNAIIDLIRDKQINTSDFPVVLMTKKSQQKVDEDNENFQSKINSISSGKRKRN